MPNEDPTPQERAFFPGIWIAIGLIVLASTGASWVIATNLYASRKSQLIAAGRRETQAQARDLAVSIRRSLHYVSGIPEFFSQAVDVTRALTALGPAPSNSKSNAGPRGASRAPPGRGGDLAKLDHTLDIAAGTFDTDLIFVIDARGDCIASSNWNRPDSLVGTNFSDRGYFKASRLGRQSQTYAVGRDTHVAGLFFSSPVRIDGRFAGLVVAKVDIENLAFLLDQTDAFVTDANGVIILAHHRYEEMHALRGAPIEHLSREAVEAIYRRPTIPVLRIDPWGDAAYPSLVRIAGQSAPQLVSTVDLPQQRLAVHAEMDLPRYVDLQHERAGLFHLLAGLLSSASLLAFLAFIYVRAMRRTRELLRASNVRFRTLEKGTFEGVAISSGGSFIDVNDQFLRMLGFAREDVVGHSIFGLIAPEDRERVREHIEGGHEGDVIEHAMLHKTGGRVFVEARGQTLEQRGVSMRLTALRDVTERRRAEMELRERGELLRAFIEHAPIALAMFDRDMRYLAISRRWRTDYGLGDGEIIGRSHYEIFPTIPYRWKMIHARALRGERMQADEDRFEQADGSVLWLSWEIWPWHSADGAIGGLVLVTEDITQRKLLQDALRKASQEAEDLYDHAPCGYFSVDADGIILKANETLVEWLGVTRDELVGKSVFGFVSAGSQARARAEFQRFTEHGSARSVELDLVRKNGSILPALLDSTSVRDADGAFVMSRTTVVDLRSRKKLERQLEALANTDPLTGVSNRRNFMRMAELEVRRLERFGGEMTVLMLDLDHFKHVNDGFGHHAGDRVLQEFAKCCSEALRGVDTLGRLGGEEFAIILPWTPREHALLVAERLRRGVEAMTLRADDGRIMRITTSIGAATAQAPDIDFERLLREADAALYEVKAMGRNGVRMFEA